ncbi:hypothetical protein BH10ACT6_BH10ACT6_01270 [soil metagenome]
MCRGVGIDGAKHPLGLVEGSTENTTVVTELLTDLRERGLDTTRPILTKKMRAATEVPRNLGHPPEP